jgi:hypothetical protein
MSLFQVNQKTRKTGSNFAEYLLKISKNDMDLRKYIYNVLNKADFSCYLPNIFEENNLKWTNKPKNSISGIKDKLKFSTSCLRFLYRNDNDNFKKYIVLPHELIDLIIAKGNIGSKTTVNEIVDNYLSLSEEDKKIYKAYKKPITPTVVVEYKQKNNPCEDNKCELEEKAQLISSLINKGVSNDIIKDLFNLN